MNGTTSRTYRAVSLGQALLLAFSLVAPFLMTGAALAAPPPSPHAAPALVTIPGNFFTVTDSGGPNDVNSEQNDLTQMGRDDSDPLYYDLFWSWDTTNFTAQMGNACALFDTDGDAKINYAVCAEIENVPSANTSVVKETARSPLAVTCSDAKDDRCTQPSDPLAFTNQIQSGDLITIDRTANLVTDTDPFPNLNPDQTWPNDSTIRVKILKSYLPANAVLANVCVYPSLGNTGNNNPFDCVVTPGGGFLNITKIAPDGTTQAFNFTVNPGSISKSITGSGTTGAFPVAIGQYSVAEGLPTGWGLSSASCALESGAPTGSQSGSTVNSVTVESGKVTTCTFTDSPNLLKITKTLTGGPAGYTGPFTIHYDCGAPYIGDVSVSAGSFATVPYIPTGSTCTITEPTLPAPPPGYSFGTPVITGSPAIIAAGTTVEVTVANTLVRNTGSLKINKVFDPLTSGFAGQFSIGYDCDDGTVHDGTVALAAGGSATISGIPTGTSCTVSEPSLPAAPVGWTFGMPSISPAQPVVINSTTTPVEVTVTNSITRDLGSLQILKTVSNPDGAPLPASFAVNYDCGAGYTGQVSVTPGSPATVPGIPTGSTCTVTEVAPAAIPGYTWGTITYTPPSVVISTKGGTFGITVGNSITRDTGSLILTKSLTGGPAGYTGPFTINYDCNDGTVHDGSVVLQAGQTSAPISGIPTGTICTVSETPPAPPVGWIFETPSFSPAATVTIADKGVTYEVITQNTLTRVPPTILVTKTANPTSVPETGGNVLFTFVVQNTSSAEPVTITSLSDSVYGTLAGDADCQLGTILAAGASCEFSFTQWVEGDFSGPDHNNVFTAVAEGNDGTDATDDDDATVDFTNVAPAILVTKTANPTAVPETGGDVTFTFVVQNTSTEEAVTITSLTDSVYGTLAGDADCQVGTVLAAGASCEFAFTQWVEGDFSGPDHNNVFTATAVDNDGTTATDNDDATVDFTDVPPTILVTKTANPTSVPETGGNVLFSFVVKNTSSEEPVTITSLSDSVYGPLAGDADCQIGTVLTAGAECTFSITQWVEGDYSGPDHVNVFTGKAVDNDNTEATDTDDATVDFTDVPPTILVTKTANPTAVPETGGNVTFTFKVQNTSSEEAVTVTGLSDSVYGTLAGDADCQVGTVLAAGAFCEFSFTRWVEGDFSGPDHNNVFTATAVDNDGTEATDDDDATVDFTDVAPTILVTKTANPTFVLIPGGNVLFTFVVQNTSTEEPVTILSLSDSVYGTLAGDADCQVGTILAAGASCEFASTQFVAGAAPAQHVNVFTAVAEDNDGTDATDNDDATVELLATTSKIAPTQTTCQAYRDGTAMDYTELFYNVSKNRIGSVAPGVIFFWSTIVAPGQTFSLESHQFNDSGALAWRDMGNLDVFLWDANCDKFQTVTLTSGSDGHPVLNVTGATPGATYYFSVKYDTGSLAGISVQKPYPTVNYTFQTWLNGSLIITSPDSIAVMPKR